MCQVEQLRHVYHFLRDPLIGLDHHSTHNSLNVWTVLASFSCSLTSKFPHARNEEAFTFGFM